MEKGINQLIVDAGLTPQKLSQKMKEDKAPFKYSKNNWRNLRIGYTKPQDPFLYIYFAKVLKVPVETIIMAYSEHETNG
jgi:hypothetical protein